jgi:SAM-dependent methyltransferase
VRNTLKGAVEAFETLGPGERPHSKVAICKKPGKEAIHYEEATVDPSYGGGKVVVNATSDLSMNVPESVRQYWDEDAATYDLVLEHFPHMKAQQAAWSAALNRHLPRPPARVLDVGAGTGSLSVLLARLGYEVTALDLSPGMLERLRSRVADEGLDVETVVGNAESPPQLPFDAVVERLLLWALPNPVATVATWRRVASGGRLVCFEGVWGVADKVEALRGRGRHHLRRLLRRPPEHHGVLDRSVREQLPYSQGMTPNSIVEVVEAAGWRSVRLERLRDVEWARAMVLPPLERMLGVTPEFAIIADDTAGP